MLLELVFISFRLVDLTLVAEWRKPFDVLAEGLDSEDSRADWRCTFPIDSFDHVKRRLMATSVHFRGEQLYTF